MSGSASFGNASALGGNARSNHGTLRGVRFLTFRRDQSCDVPFGVKPTKSMCETEKLELPCIITQEWLIDIEVVEHDAPPDGSLRQLVTMVWGFDSPLIELFSPLSFVFPDDLVTSELGYRAEQSEGKLVGFQVIQGVVAEDIVRIGTSNHFEEIESALGVRRHKVGEEVIADVQRVTVLSVVLGPRIVSLEECRNFPGGNQQRLFLGMKQVMALREHPMRCTWRRYRGACHLHRYMDGTCGH